MVLKRLCLNTHAIFIDSTFDFERTFNLISILIFNATLLAPLF